MGETQRKLQVRPLHLGTITNAGDGELALKAGGHTSDDVLNQRTRHAPGRTGLAAVINGGDDNAVIGHLGLDQIHEHHRELTLGALRGYLLAIDSDRHAADRGDRLFANTRHFSLPSLRWWGLLCFAS